MTLFGSFALLIVAMTAVRKLNAGIPLFESVSCEDDTSFLKKTPHSTSYVQLINGLTYWDVPTVEVLRDLRNKLIPDMVCLYIAKSHVNTRCARL